MPFSPASSSSPLSKPRISSNSSAPSRPINRWFSKEGRDFHRPDVWGEPLRVPALVPPLLPLRPGWLALGEDQPLPDPGATTTVASLAAPLRRPALHVHGGDPATGPDPPGPLCLRELYARLPDKNDHPLHGKAQSSASEEVQAENIISRPKRPALRPLSGVTFAQPPGYFLSNWIPQMDTYVSCHSNRTAYWRHPRRGKYIIILK